MIRKRLKKEDRKCQLKDASIDLIAKNGYRNTTVQNIVDKANFSKGGFYNCYNNKEELFKEILNDGMQTRYNQLITYNQPNNKIERKSFMIEALLNKLLDYNKYKAMYCTLMIEMSNDPSLTKLYNDSESLILNEFINFCKDEKFNEYIKLIDDEFFVFLNSIILGMEVFKNKNAPKYKELIRDILTAYFDKINLFSE